MKRILVIEENPVTALIIKSLLTRCGHAVVCTPTGPQGVDRFYRRAFDLVIVAFMMDGLNSLLTIRQRNPTVPILVMSSHLRGCESDSYLRLATAFGATDTIAKPFELELFEEKVTRLLAITPSTGSQSEPRNLAQAVEVELS